MKIVATTSLPAVDRPDADRWNAARSRQYKLNKDTLEKKIHKFLHDTPKDKAKDLTP